jgi:hypothetical protein
MVIKINIKIKTEVYQFIEELKVWNLKITKLTIFTIGLSLQAHLKVMKSQINLDQ